MIEQILKTRIVCTIGPSSDSEEELDSMIEAGMNVARLNFSHGNHEYYKGLIDRIRKASALMGLPVAILQDLQGPRMRIGEFHEGSFKKGSMVQLNAGNNFKISTEKVDGNSEIVHTPYQELPKLINKDDLILLNDGSIELQVVSVIGPEINTKINVGGYLPSRKGINIPNVSIENNGLTDKDLADLEFGIKYGVDYVAVSFVQDKKDIVNVREAIDSINSDRSNISIISKLERPIALDNLDEIVLESDGIMVARGDLGVEIGIEKVPSVQKRIIDVANKNGKFVVIATQMLESMVNTTRPTRAEASDVANAIFDGADAVMLSAETAVGVDPTAAVSMIAEIIREAEKNEDDWGHFVEDMNLELDKLPALALSRASKKLAETLNASALIVFTRSGSTATLVSKTRPPVPIVAFTTSTATYNKMAMLKGVSPFVLSRAMSFEELMTSAEKVLLKSSNIKQGDKIVIIAGLPIKDMRSANIVLFCTVGEKVLI
tara:strand:+ start:377 stop:1849 length:1473 start_codon:yes stop_codon:yes gene_type:complete